MRKLVCFVLFSFFYVFCYCQNETSNWYFGDKAGINFNNSSVNILNDGAMTTPAGCSSISDIEGNLLFYTNGKTVWNKNHTIMEGGEGLVGEPETSQPTIIIPKPNSTNTYYIFSTRKTRTRSPLLYPGIYYSEVEISNDHPLGIVTNKNVKIANSKSQRITAVHHRNGKDIWVVFYGSNGYNFPDDIFFAFKIDENGINSPIRTKLNTINEIDQEGQMKASPDGKKIALSTNETIYIYNFDNLSGTLSKYRFISLRINFTDFYTCYGISFSPNSRFLYFSSLFTSFEGYTYNIVQVDTESENFFKIGEHIFTTEANRVAAASQLSMNGKIYFAQINSEDIFDYGGFIIGRDLFPTNVLGVINNPDELGVASNYNHDSINLENGISYFGLPNFIQSYFRNRIITENQCVFDTFDFSLDSYAPIKSVAWNFGDGTSSNEINPQHSYNTPGEFEVTATININDQNVQLYKKVTVFPLPDLIPDQRIIQCDNDADGISLFNLNNIADQISKDSTYTFKFYRSMTNAENDMNEISDPENFYNESNPQTIYAKATTINGCSSIESFSIETILKPSLTISPIIVCGELDNTGVFNLENKKNEIINDFSLSPLEEVSFFASLSDAQKTINTLPPKFLSASTTIWVKIESEQECSSISPIDLIANSPQINLEDNYTICISPSNHSSITLIGDPSNDNFEWRDENNNIISTNNTFTLTRAGEFSLTAYKTINGIQCSNFKAFTVNYPPPPDILDVQVNVINETENNVTITIIGDSSYEYSLDDDTYVGNGTSHTFTNVTPGIATIYIRDINKCESPTETSASIIGYPKFLTPNADGFNDYWKVYGANSNFFKEIDVKIFNRFGKTLYVFNNENAHIGWDGTYNGIHLPTNDYWFHAKLKDLDDNIIDKKGHFTLKRN